MVPLENSSSVMRALAINREEQGAGLDWFAELCLWKSAATAHDRMGRNLSLEASWERG